TQQPDAGSRPLGADAGRYVNVLDFQRVLVVALLRAGDGDEGLLAFADDQRGVLRAEEAGAVRRRAEETVWGDADEVGQLGPWLRHPLGEEWADGGVLDRPAGDVPGGHLVRGRAVVGLTRRHRADEGHHVHVPGNLRQMLTDLDAGYAGLDLLERPAVGVA